MGCRLAVARVVVMVVTKEELKGLMMVAYLVAQMVVSMVVSMVDKSAAWMVVQ